MSNIQQLLLKKYKDNNLKELELKINYDFNDKLLLVKALAHPSIKQYSIYNEYFSKQKYEYEKLELLGDSILGFSIIEILMDQYSNFQVGHISRLKNYLVSKDVVSKVGLEVGLAKFIIMSLGEKKSKGLENLSTFENAMEALLAAIYLDANDIKQASSIIKALWEKYLIHDMHNYLDSKSELQELCHKKGITPIYQVLSHEGAEHDRIFTIRAKVGEYFADGIGKSKKIAEKEAAKKILQINYKLF